MVSSYDTFIMDSMTNTMIPQQERPAWLAWLGSAGNSTPGGTFGRCSDTRSSISHGETGKTGFPPAREWRM